MTAPPRLRSTANLGALPDVTFGVRSLAWWGTLGFMVIEGTTLAVVAFCYVYLRKNFVTWPPLGNPLPDLGVPVAQLLVMALSVGVMYLAARAARRLDYRATRNALVLEALIKGAILVLRWYEFSALNVHWNTNAYGSAAWIIVGTHATLLVVDFAEDIGLLLILMVAGPRPRYFSDVVDDAMYWYFTVASWVPLFALVFLSPRFL